MCCFINQLNNTSSIIQYSYRKQFHSAPTDWNEKNASSILAKHKYWTNIFILLMDEDIITGRPFWGWFKHRLEEFRKTKLEVDDNYNTQTLSNDNYT